MDQFDTRWIVVHDRQGDLRAEAETERLARLVRKDIERTDASASRHDIQAARHDGSPIRHDVMTMSARGTSAAVLAAARVDVGHRPIEVGAALAAERKFPGDRDCSEAA